MTKALHPELDLPYGEYIIIAEQAAPGALWIDRFDWEKMALIEKIHRSGHAFIFQVRKSTDRKDPDFHIFFRKLWLRTPS